jgi:Zn-dependent protease
MKFTQQEVNDLLISWIVLSIAFALFTRNGAYGILRTGVSGFPIHLLQMLVIVGTAFVLHELSHKYVAQNYGLWAEYRKWNAGLLLALLLSLTGFFFFAAPGAVMIMSTGWVTREIEAKTSIAGPASNITVGIVALLIRGAGFFPEFLAYLATINFFLAIFNLLPIPPMDGSKIIKYNVLMWLIPFLLAIVLLIYAF